MNQRSRLLVVAVIGIMSSAACGEEPTDPAGASEAVASVEISPESISFDALGEQRLVSLSVRDVNGHEVSGVDASWSSRDAAVAGVDQEGRIRSVAQGTATVIAAVGSISDSLQVIVAQKATALEVAVVDSILWPFDTTSAYARFFDANGRALSEPFGPEWKISSGLRLRAELVSNPAYANLEALDSGVGEVMATAGDFNDSATLLIKKAPSFLQIGFSTDLRQNEMLRYSFAGELEAWTVLPSGAYDIAYNSDHTLLAILNADAIRVYDTAGHLIELWDADAIDPAPSRGSFGGSVSWGGDRIGAQYLTRSDTVKYVVFTLGTTQAHVVANIPVRIQGTFAGSPQLSPDGRYLAYLIKESGDSSVIELQDIQAGSVERRLWTSRLTPIAWHPTNGRLYMLRYQSGLGNQVVSTVPGNPELRLDLQLFNTAGRLTFSPDGSKFIIDADGNLAVFHLSEQRSRSIGHARGKYIVGVFSPSEEKILALIQLDEGYRVVSMDPYGDNWRTVTGPIDSPPWLGWLYDSAAQP